MAKIKEGQSEAVSRRRLLQGAVAATVIAATPRLSAEGGAKQKTVVPPTCDNTIDPAAYPALAGWLVLTTNQDLFDSVGASNVASRLKVNQVALQTLRDKISGKKSVPFDPPSSWAELYGKVHTDFQTLANDGTGYTGPACPRTFETIEAIVKNLCQ